jgi:hypothetical protein
MSSPYVPPEIIRIVLGFLRDDRKSLAACTLVNHTFNLYSTPILYHTVSFSFPRTFTLFSDVTVGESQRSKMINHLDLSSFSTMGLQKSDSSIQLGVTPEILINILRSCTMLEAFSVSESLESVITLEVLKVLVFECKNLKALDFCAFSNKQFDKDLTSLAEIMGKVKLIKYYNEEEDEDEEEEEDDDDDISFQKSNNNILLPKLERLSLHKCPIISEYSSLLTLLSHSPNLTHLDLGGCSISDITLKFLLNETNITKTLTHLLLSKCKNISSKGISNLVIKCEKLEFLNIHECITNINEYDIITMILSSISSKNFKSLDIGGGRISNLTNRTLYSIQENCNISLKYLGLANSNITSINYLQEFLKSMPNLEYIDLTSIPCLNTPLDINNLLNNLQKDHSLQIIEMKESLLNKLCAVNGWEMINNYSRRCYYAKRINNDNGGTTTRPDRAHPRKLDVTESGSERMSKIFQYYSFDV